MLLKYFSEYVLDMGEHLKGIEIFLSLLNKLTFKPNLWHSKQVIKRIKESAYLIKNLSRSSKGLADVYS